MGDTLSVVNSNGGELTEAEQQELSELFRGQLKENMDGVEARIPIITLESGGFFKMPPDREHQEEWATKSLEAFVVKKQAVRSYYSRSRSDNDDEVNLPDCFSTDCHHPNEQVESPLSESCAACPMNEWGSATDDAGNQLRGKACREKRRLFVRVGENPIPYMLHIPLTSIKSFDSFVTNLTAACLPLTFIKVKMTAKETSKGERKWSLVEFERSGEIRTKEEALALKAMQDSIDPEVKDTPSRPEPDDNVPF